MHDSSIAVRAYRGPKILNVHIRKRVSCSRTRINVACLTPVQIIISYQHNRLHDRQIENHWIIDRFITDCGETIYQEKRSLSVNEITNQHLKIVTWSIKCQSVKSYMFVYAHEICESRFIRLCLVDIYCILRILSASKLPQELGLVCHCSSNMKCIRWLCLPFNTPFSFFFFMRFFIFSHDIWIAA